MSDENRTVAQRLAEVLEIMLKEEAVDARFRKLTSELQKLGFDAINYGYFDPAAAERDKAEVMFLSTMSSGWLDYYYNRTLHLTDPHVVMVRSGNLAPYLWGLNTINALDDQAHRTTALEGVEAGLVSALCVPLSSRDDPRTPVAGLTLGSSLPSKELSTTIREGGPTLVTIAHLFHALSIGELQQSALGTRPLSARERDCLQLVARGMRIDAIGDRLGIATVTVEMHLRAARQRLGARTTAEAVARALLSSQIQLS